MNNRFARLLKDQHQVDHFLNDVLKVNKRHFKDIGYRIITCESGMVGGYLTPTSRFSRFRDPAYQSDEQRLLLRKRIIDELFTLPLLGNDERIRLGRGGARPSTLQAKRQAYILIGLPASGKSSVAQQIANTYGAMVLDSDFAKRKLPEYDGYPWGASIVHEESTDIILNENNIPSFECLLDKVSVPGYNVVIPKIGADSLSILQLYQVLSNLNYAVHITLIHLSKEKATLRALSRYKSTDRYIPLSMIFDVYADRPALTYFFLKDKHRTKFRSFGIINTDVNKGQAPMCTDIWQDNPAGLYTLNRDLLF